MRVTDIRCLPRLGRAAGLLTGLLLTLSGGAHAQTAEQLKLFSQLPAAQQQTLMKQFTQGGSGGPLGPGTGRYQQTPSDMGVADESSAGRMSDELSRSDNAQPVTLRPFGYDLFRQQPSTFAPTSDVPVPADYVLGPGDTLLLWLYGKEIGDYSLTIDRNGQVFLPEIGPVALAGLRFSEARQVISDSVSQAKIGVSANLAMGELRSIRVFVSGDARFPGSYTVSALSTMVQALYVSGGVKEIGSLRAIQLRRGNEVVATLDLYQLLLEGDASSDARLQSGDVVFVPPVGQTVGIQGAVRRPAIYEVNGTTRVNQLVALAGGLLPGAVVDRVTIERVKNGYRSLLNAQLRAGQGSPELLSGDVVSIHEPIEDVEDGVEISGPVRWPGKHALFPGARLSDFIRGPQDLEPFSDLDFALVLRRSEDGSRLEPMYVNPRRALAGDSEADILMRAGDHVHVFTALAEVDDSELNADGEQLTEAQLRLARSLGLGEQDIERESGERGKLVAANASRDSAQRAAAAALALTSGTESEQQPASGMERATPSETAREKTKAAERQTAGPASEERLSRNARMDKLVDTLKATARVGAPAPVVSVVGAVRFPGRVPLDPRANSVADVLRAVGGRTYTAEKGFVEVVRAPTRVGADERANRIILRAEQGSIESVRIYPGDTVAVRDVPGATDQRTVRILGEVIYPGTYQVTEGTSLRDLILRAGGLSQKAFAKGAVFTREDLRRKEEEQVARLKERLKGDLAAAALTKAGTSNQAALGMQALGDLFEQLTEYEAVGRLVINVREQLALKSAPITLEDGDTLIIPKTPEEVTVIGEVQFPTSHRWEPGLRRDVYLKRSGGFTSLADGRRTFVIRADGSVESGRGWFAREPVLEPGDLVVVPFDATPIQPLTVFGAVTQVIYQLALSIAAFNSVGAF